MCASALLVVCASALLVVCAFALLVVCVSCVPLHCFSALQGVCPFLWSYSVDFVCVALVSLHWLFVISQISQVVRGFNLHKGSIQA